MKRYYMKLASNHALAAATLIRLSLGVLFFFAGLAKVMNYQSSVQGIIDGASKTWLPLPLLSGFAYLLPYVELILGILLIAGLMTHVAYLGAGLLLITLEFGVILTGQYDTAAHNAFYLFMLAIGWTWVGRNPLSLDHLIGWTDDYESAELSSRC
jgi:thiosulfate dehydrogenase (quinone) large subunit